MPRAGSLDRPDGHWLSLLTRVWREPGDLDAILNRIAEVAKEIFVADLCAIFAINPVTRKFVERPGVAGELLPADGEDPLKHPREHGLTQRVIREGWLAVEDVTSLPDDEAGFCLKQEVRSFAAVTLRTVRTDKPLAVLYVDFREPRKLPEGLEDSLPRFAGLASRELQITWFLRRYQWVGQIGQRINRRVLSEVELFEELSERVARIIDTSGCVVWGHHRPSRRTLDLHVGSTVRRDCEVDSSLGRFLEGQGRGGTGRPTVDQVVELLTSRGFVPEQPELEAGSLLFERLTHLEAPLGFVAILHPSAGAFDDEDRHLLALLASQVALALSNRRLFDHLRRLHEAGRTLSRNLQSETVLQTIVDTVRNCTHCDLAVLYPVDQATEGAFLPAQRSARPGDDDRRAPNGPSWIDLARSLLDEPTPRFVDDVRAHVAPWAEGTEGGESRLDAAGGFRSLAGVPLRIGDEPVGALLLWFRSAQQFQNDAPQRQLIEGLAEYAALAIENARRFGAEQARYIEVLKDLRDLDQKLIASNDLEELLQTILDIAGRRLAERIAPDEASILLYDPHREELVTRVAVGPHATESEDQVLRVEDGRGITLEVLRTGRSILVPDIRAPEYRDRFVDVGGDTRCELDVPLKDGEQVVGILNLESRTPRAFDERDRQLMETLAGQAVLAVKKARAFEEEQRLRQDEETLIELGKELTRRLDAQELLDLILQRAIDKTRSQAGVLVEVDAKQGEMVVRAEQGASNAELGRRLSVEVGILGLVARKGQAVNADLTQPKWQEVHLPVVPGMTSELAVPMKQGDDVTGVINVESPRELAFDQHNERLLEGLADLAVIALQNAERYEIAERRRSRFELLHQAGQRLGRVASLEDLTTAYGIVVEIATQQFESEVVVRRFDGTTRELERVASARTEGPQVFTRIPLSDPLNGRVARERRTLVVHDAEDPPPEIGRFPRSNDDRSFVVTPILFEDTYYGNLSLSHQEPDKFRDLDVQLVEGLAQQLALTIHRLVEARAHQEVETIGEIGRQSYELMHRLGNDLAPVRYSARKIRRKIREQAVSDPEILQELQKIVTDVSGPLELSRKLAERLAAELRSTGDDEDREAYRVVQLVQDAVSGLAIPEGEEDRFRIEVDVPEDCKGVEVRVSHREMIDVLLNLLRNALDAMPGGGRLTVEVARTDQNVEIRVKDTGQGINPGNLRKIFDLAFTTKPGSSGFGLWSVRRTLARSGGEIRAHSEVGVGSTFTVILPRVEEDCRA